MSNGESSTPPTNVSSEKVESRAVSYNSTAKGVDVSKPELKKSDFKPKRSWLIPLWLDILFFAALCGVVATSAVFALTNASVLLGFAILWLGTIALGGLRFGVKRVRQLFS